MTKIQNDILPFFSVSSKHCKNNKNVVKCCRTRKRRKRKRKKEQYCHRCINIRKLIKYEKYNNLKNNYVYIDLKKIIRNKSYENNYKYFVKYNNIKSSNIINSNNMKNYKKKYLESLPFYNDSYITSMYIYESLLLVTWSNGIITIFNHKYNHIVSRKVTNHLIKNLCMNCSENIIAFMDNMDSLYFINLNNNIINKEIHKNVIFISNDIYEKGYNYNNIDYNNDREFDRLSVDFTYNKLNKKKKKMYYMNNKKDNIINVIISDEIMKYNIKNLTTFCINPYYNKNNNNNICVLTNKKTVSLIYIYEYHINSVLLFNDDNILNIYWYESYIFICTALSLFVINFFNRTKIAQMKFIGSLNGNLDKTFFLLIENYTGKEKEFHGYNKINYIKRKEKKKDDHMDNQTDDHMDNQMDNQTDDHMDNQMDDHMDNQMDDQMDDQMDNQTDDQMDNQTDDQKDNRKNQLIHCYKNNYPCTYENLLYVIKTVWPNLFSVHICRGIEKGVYIIAKEKNIKIIKIQKINGIEKIYILKDFYIENYILSINILYNTTYNILKNDFCLSVIAFNMDTYISNVFTNYKEIKKKKFLEHYILTLNHFFLHKTKITIFATQEKQNEENDKIHVEGENINIQNNRNNYNINELYNNNHMTYKTIPQNEDHNVNINNNCVDDIIQSQKQKITNISHNNNNNNQIQSNKNNHANQTTAREKDNFYNFFKSNIYDMENRTCNNILQYCVINSKSYLFHNKSSKKYIYKTKKNHQFSLFIYSSINNTFIEFRPKTIEEIFYEFMLERKNTNILYKKNIMIKKKKCSTYKKNCLSIILKELRKDKKNRKELTNIVFKLIVHFCKNKKYYIAAKIFIMMYTYLDNKEKVIYDIFKIFFLHNKLYIISLYYTKLKYALQNKQHECFKKRKKNKHALYNIHKTIFLTTNSLIMKDQKERYYNTIRVSKKLNIKINIKLKIEKNVKNLVYIKHNNNNNNNNNIINPQIKYITLIKMKKKNKIKSMLYIIFCLIKYYHNINFIAEEKNKNNNKNYKNDKMSNNNHNNNHNNNYNIYHNNNHNNYHNNNHNNYHNNYHKIIRPFCVQQENNLSIYIKKKKKGRHKLKKEVVEKNNEKKKKKIEMYEENNKKYYNKHIKKNQKNEKKNFFFLTKNLFNKFLVFLLYSNVYEFKKIFESSSSEDLNIYMLSKHIIYLLKDNFIFINNRLKNYYNLYRYTLYYRYKTKKTYNNNNFLYKQKKINKKFKNLKINNSNTNSNPNNNRNIKYNNKNYCYCNLISYCKNIKKNHNNLKNINKKYYHYYNQQRSRSFSPSPLHQPLHSTLHPPLRSTLHPPLRSNLHPPLRSNLHQPLRSLLCCFCSSPFVSSPAQDHPTRIISSNAEKKILLDILLYIFFHFDIINFKDIDCFFKDCLKNDSELLSVNKKILNFEEKYKLITTIGNKIPFNDITNIQNKQDYHIKNNFHTNCNSEIIDPKKFYTIQTKEQEEYIHPNVPKNNNIYHINNICDNYKKNNSLSSGYHKKDDNNNNNIYAKYCLVNMSNSIYNIKQKKKEHLIKEKDEKIFNKYCKKYQKNIQDENVNDPKYNNNNNNNISKIEKKNIDKYNFNNTYIIQESKNDLLYNNNHHHINITNDKYFYNLNKHTYDNSHFSKDTSFNTLDYFENQCDNVKKLEIIKMLLNIKSEKVFIYLKQCNCNVVKEIIHKHVIKLCKLNLKKTVKLLLIINIKEKKNEEYLFYPHIIINKLKKKPYYLYHYLKNIKDEYYLSKYINVIIFLMFIFDPLYLEKFINKYYKYIHFKKILFFISFFNYLYTSQQNILSFQKKHEKISNNNLVDETIECNDKNGKTGILLTNIENSGVHNIVCVDKNELQKDEKSKCNNNNNDSNNNDSNNNDSNNNDSNNKDSNNKDSNNKDSNNNSCIDKHISANVIEQEKKNPILSYIFCKNNFMINKKEKLFVNRNTKKSMFYFKNKYVSLIYKHLLNDRDNEEDKKELLSIFNIVQNNARTNINKSLEFFLHIKALVYLKFGYINRALQIFLKLNNYLKIFYIMIHHNVKIYDERIKRRMKYYIGSSDYFNNSIKKNKYGVCKISDSKNKTFNNNIVNIDNIDNIDNIVNIDNVDNIVNIVNVDNIYNIYNNYNSYYHNYHDVRNKLNNSDKTILIEKYYEDNKNNFFSNNINYDDILYNRRESNNYNDDTLIFKNKINEHKKFVVNKKYKIIKYIDNTYTFKVNKYLSRKKLYKKLFMLYHKIVIYKHIMDIKNKNNNIFNTNDDISLNINDTLEEQNKSCNSIDYIIEKGIHNNSEYSFYNKQIMLDLHNHQEYVINNIKQEKNKKKIKNYNDIILEIEKEKHINSNLLCKKNRKYTHNKNYNMLYLNNNKFIKNKIPKYNSDTKVLQNYLNNNINHHMNYFTLTYLLEQCFYKNDLCENYNNILLNNKKSIFNFLNNMKKKGYTIYNGHMKKDIKKNEVNLLDINDFYFLNNTNNKTQTNKKNSHDSFYFDEYNNKNTIQNHKHKYHIQKRKISSNVYLYEDINNNQYISNISSFCSLCLNNVYINPNTNKDEANKKNTLVFFFCNHLYHLKCLHNSEFLCKSCES